MSDVEMSDVEFRHLLANARDAQRGGNEAWHVQSTGEKLAVAFVLNHPEWLAEMKYTLAEAVDRIGPEWLDRSPRVARALGDEAD